MEKCFMNQIIILMSIRRIFYKVIVLNFQFAFMFVTINWIVDITSTILFFLFLC